MIFHIIDVNHLRAELAFFDIATAVGFVEVYFFDGKLFGAIATFLGGLCVIHLKCFNCYFIEV